MSNQVEMERGETRMWLESQLCESFFGLNVFLTHAVQFRCQISFAFLLCLPGATTLSSHLECLTRLITNAKYIQNCFSERVSLKMPLIVKQSQECGAKCQTRLGMPVYVQPGKLMIAVPIFQYRISNKPAYT